MIERAEIGIEILGVIDLTAGAVARDILIIGLRAETTIEGAVTPTIGRRVETVTAETTPQMGGLDQGTALRLEVAVTAGEMIMTVAETELETTQMTGEIDVEIVTVMTITGGDLRISMTGEISAEIDLESRENSSEPILPQQNPTPICSAA